MRARSLRHVVVAALSLSMVAAGSLATGVRAAEPLSLTFQAQRGSCIDGQSNHDINLELYDSHGTPSTACPGWAVTRATISMRVSRPAA